MKFIAHIIYRLEYLFLKCIIPPSASIGKGVIICHSIGVVIHNQAVIGENTIIYQNVTIGGGPRVVGKNCLLGSGCVVLANVGDNVKVGANAVVVKEFGSDLTLVGVPAKPIIK